MKYAGAFVNPNDVNYGAWMEQRRQVFLDSMVRNPYFRYSAGATLALLVLALLHTKQRIDHRRSMWVTAEMMTDLYKHDAYSRQVARDARSREAHELATGGQHRSRQARSGRVVVREGLLQREGE